MVYNSVVSKSRQDSATPKSYPRRQETNKQLSRVARRQRKSAVTTIEEKENDPHSFRNDGNDNELSLTKLKSEFEQHAKEVVITPDDNEFKPDKGRMKLASLLLRQELSQISSPNTKSKNDIDMNTLDKSKESSSSELYNLTDPPSVSSKNTKLFWL